ncbi:MAG: hypothetical protein K5821_06970 [Nitrobacter sp.]|uniref:hypothetical protein n=1 Tax=Nitrobacter sp. TaxID=29420 RepID=UPI00261091FC|nr:hypothetical protein [Nitrobacter sp.]MCV0386160.1 hypothetical protein [Nitrobacter sp.]
MKGGSLAEATQPVLAAAPHVGCEAIIDLHDVIDTIKRHLADGSDRALTYAALECRLAIERICYDRLARAHDYLSHKEVRRWQPHHVIKLLEDDVDHHRILKRNNHIENLGINVELLKKKILEKASSELRWRRKWKTMRLTIFDAVRQRRKDVQT